ncbi:MAG: cell division protein ZapE [Gammaproteobacteria bacterium]
MKRKNDETPLDVYNDDLYKKGFVHDPAQKLAFSHTQRLYTNLVKPIKKTFYKRSVFERIFQKKNDPKIKPIKGLYFWGGVGRGKTYIMDSFYNCLPFEDKTRIHFHSFMRNIHRELKDLKNIENPLIHVAKRYAIESRVICFDEFHVSDITDAMLLANLFSALFDQNVVLVATSNEHPDDLYSGGLQRERFLPAINLIKKHTDVVCVDSGVDYRFRLLEKAEIYLFPSNDETDKILADSFEKIAPEEGVSNETVEIEGRSIYAIKYADSVAWFDFKALCDGPRGASDYIEIARIFQTVLVSNIPVLDSSCDDNAKRFITMIDEFYDRRVKLIISAEVPAEDLYTGTRLAKSFKRTVSRLQEMGTKEYLSSQHISD